MSHVEDDRYYTSAEDPNLSNNTVIKSKPAKFNSEQFDPDGICNDYMVISDCYPKSGTANSPTSVFYVTNGQIRDNPITVIDKWEITLKYLNGRTNNDLEVINLTEYGQNQEMMDKFKVKLKLGASPKRIVEIRGKATGPYKLFYFDNNTWNLILESSDPKPDENSVLGYWDATKLNGLYTVLLRADDGTGKIQVDTQEVQVGEKFEPGNKDINNLTAISPYRRAEILFSTNSFPVNKVVSITPLKLSEIPIKNKPNIFPIGPILEFKPSPYTFPEGEEPVLTFKYTYDEAVENNMTGGNVNIYKISDDGNLKYFNTTASYYLLGPSEQYEPVEDIYSNPWDILVLSARIDTFSDFVVLKGDIPPRIPTIVQPLTPTDKENIAVFGTGDLNRTIVVYVDDDGELEDEDDLTPAILQEQTMDITEFLPDDTTRGSYSVGNVNLAYEEENYIFVTYANMVNRPAAQVNVVKDKSPAVFTEFSIDPLYISPNGDGVQDYAGISFRLNEPGTVYYKCYNSSGNELKNEAISASGDVLSQITWDGLDENGRNLKEGIYDIRLFVADSLGNISPDSDQLNTVVLDITPPSLTGPDSVLTPFSPNGDNVQDNALINYALSEKCYVTITINDTAGNVIRTVRDNELRNKGAYEEAWDGIDDAGTRPAEQEYVIRIDYHDQAGNKGVTAQSRTELDVTAPLILKQTADPTNFSSKGKGSQGTEIKYQLTDNAYVTIRALNSSGQEVCTVISGQYRDQGYNTDVWKGNNSNGDPVPDGIYTLKIEASDDAGNTAEARTIEVKVVSDTILPVISNISDSPDPITPSSPYSYGKNDI
ncbi:MAG: FlgD immunoglobulin-like domain containing protein, partial [bacterium]|nr:FlgD immunoglobulin-like domain containing protein [bacterium]